MLLEMKLLQLLCLLSIYCCTLPLVCTRVLQLLTWGSDIMTVPTANDAIAVSKVAIALDHIRNNRIEYLVLLLLSHMVGVTTTVYEKAQGMC